MEHYPLVQSPSSEQSTDSSRGKAERRHSHGCAQRRRVPTSWQIGKASLYHLPESLPRYAASMAAMPANSDWGEKAAPPAPEHIQYSIVTHRGTIYFGQAPELAFWASLTFARSTANLQTSLRCLLFRIHFTCSPNSIPVLCWSPEGFSPRKPAQVTWALLGARDRPPIIPKPFCDTLPSASSSGS